MLRNTQLDLVMTQQQEASLSAQVSQLETSLRRANHEYTESKAVETSLRVEVSHLREQIAKREREHETLSREIARLKSSLMSVQEHATIIDRTLASGPEHAQ